MADLPSRLDLFSIGRDYVLQRATRIDPAQVDVQGSDVNIIVGVASVLAYAVMVQLGYRTAALLLDGAEGDDLDRYAFDRYQLTRKGAAAAVVPVVITRPNHNAGAGTVPAGTQLTTNTGAQYVTLTNTSFTATGLTAAPTATARAAQAGTSTQVGAGAITGFAQAGLLFDPSLQVTNTVSAAGGADPEDDDTFRARVRDYWLTARRGTLSAIVQGALSVDGVASAQAIEALNTSGQPARVVNLYVADANGIANQALGATVQAALDDYRAAGITVLVATSLPLLVNIELSLTFAANIDTLSLTDTVKSAVVEYVNSLPVNGTLYVAQLYSVLQRYVADGLIPTHGSIAVPTGDLVPGVGQTIRTTLENITVLS